MATVATYDAKRVVITVNGVPIEGSGESDFVSVEYDEQIWNKVYGAKGEAARSKQNSPGGVITITLKQTDRASIEFLDSLADLDEATNLGIVSIMIKDLTTGEGIMANQAWLQARPSLEFGREISEREYVYDCAQIVRI